MTKPNPAEWQEPKADLRATGKSIATWLISRKTGATLLSSFAVTGIFTIAIGNYFSHLTSRPIISQQTSKLLINKGLLVSEVDNTHRDLDFASTILFGSTGQSDLGLFEICQQNEDNRSNFISPQRSSLSLPGATLQSPAKDNCSEAKTLRGRPTKELMSRINQDSPFFIRWTRPTTTKNAENAVDKILKPCNTTLPLDKTITPVSASIGIAVTRPNSEISPRQIIETADQAMLNAKQQGRNQIT